MKIPRPQVNHKLVAPPESKGEKTIVSVIVEGCGYPARESNTSTLKL